MKNPPINTLASVPTMPARRDAEQPAPAGCATVCVSVPVLARKLASPLYVAVIGSVPAGSALVVNVTWPPALSVPVIGVVMPPEKVTVPVGVPVPAVTVAVNTTAWPTMDGLGADVSAVVVAALLTVCVSVPVLPRKLALPLYVAVIVSVPAGSALVVNVTWPPALSVPMIGVVMPPERVTVPVGVTVPAVTVAVNTTGWPNTDGSGVDVSVVVVVRALL